MLNLRILQPIFLIRSLIFKSKILDCKFILFLKFLIFFGSKNYIINIPTFMILC